MYMPPRPSLSHLSPHLHSQMVSWVLTGFSCQVLLKLFSYCVKVKVNRQQLVKLEMNTLNVMLGTLNLVERVGCKDKAWASVGGQSQVGEGHLTPGLR